MEYGIWGLHAAGGLWGDPRLTGRHPILPPGAPQILSRIALNSLHHHPSTLGTLAEASRQAMELATKSSIDQVKEEPSDDPIDINCKSDDNESNIEKEEDEENGQQV